MRIVSPPGSGRGSADGEAADFLGCGDVSVQESRREIADGDIIKPVAGIVFGEECRCVNVQGEQVANRILIFGAIEAA